jgi:hypothetical protein
MASRKPTSLVRVNRLNGIRIKKHLSREYGAPTQNLGTEAFEKLRKTKRAVSGIKASATKVAKLSTDSVANPRKTALAAFSHFVAHGDHTSMAALVISAPNNRARGLLVAWFERVGQLRWDNTSQRFRGKPDRSRLSVEAAICTPIPRASGALRDIVVYNYPRNSVFSSNKCAVCGHPAMPGEDTCYHHQSG